MMLDEEDHTFQPGGPSPNLGGKPRPERLHAGGDVAQSSAERITQISESISEKLPRISSYEWMRTTGHRGVAVS